MIARRAGSARRSAATAIVLGLLVASGCDPASTGRSPVPGSADPSVRAEIADLPDLGLAHVATQTAAARAATIGPDGGSIEATAVDGTTFALAIPPGAVAKATQIALYPVSNVAGLAAGSKLTAAVQLTPDGLNLDAPATLTIGLAAPAPTSLVGLSWHGDGASPHPYPVTVAGNTATLRIYHFSGDGIGDIPLQPINSCGSQADMEVAMTDAIHDAANQVGDARGNFTRVLKLCFANFVAPTLRAASTMFVPDEIDAAVDARNAYDFWFSGVTFWAAGFFPGFTLSPELEQSRQLAVTFLRNWFQTSNLQCIADADVPSAAVLDAGVAVEVPHRFGGLWGIDTRANKLDYQTLLDDACVQVVIDASRGFSGSKPGDAGTVTIPVGYTIVGGAERHDMPIHVALTQTGDSTPFADGEASADGRFTASLTWPVDVNQLQIDVLAAFDEPSIIARFDRITKRPGSKIVFATQDGAGGSRIGVMDDDGRNVQMLTAGPRDLTPVWSADGAQIAFARWTGSGAPSATIEVMNADGSGLHALTQGPDDTAPAFSPDGARIAFLRGHPTASPAWPTIVVANADGSNQRDTGVKAAGGGTRISWSPDSQRIVYSAYDDGPDSGTVRLWVMSAAGGAGTKLVTHACEPWGAAWPEWSPTGDRIAFFCDTHGNPDGSNWIAVVSSSGGGYRALTSNLIGKLLTNGPTWSPDASKVAIAERTGIVIVALAGGATSTLSAATPGQITAMDWGP
ncbi:MAG TPA: hypothetical protein VF484_08935 [Candidatus Limnocylindrales bacterium]